jgi:hypothetical protein
VVQVEVRMFMVSENFTSFATWILPAKRRRVVDCVKILFEVTKESADWCPALKAVLGGVSVLIKHYEVFGRVDSYARN